MPDALSILLDLVNETLTAATVVIAVSLLLYNLTRNLHDRVARSSSVVLACVTVAYIGDVFILLEPSHGVYEAALRLQWVGIAFMPAALFHLSDSLLATTGLPSRGRRRRIIRILYAISGAFLIAAAFTNVLIQPMYYVQHVGMRGGPLLPVYIAYFVIAAFTAFINVQRARQRCLTRDTRRRMAYLQFAMLTPALGVFPYSLLLGPGQEFSLGALLLVNAANIVVILMLLFLAYPLSFFGSRKPDRVVKTELLRFILRGPATGLLALATIIFINPASRILGLSGQSFMPFAVVAVVLFWQWSVALALPWIEKRLIYPDEDDDQLSKLQNLSEQLLTRNDLLQLMEAILAGICDYLQVNTAFAVALRDNQPEMIAAIGPSRPTNGLLEDETNALIRTVDQKSAEDQFDIHIWRSYWIVPLFSKRENNLTDSSLSGFIGVQARSSQVDLSTEEYRTFQSFVHRAASTLDDLALQTEIYAALEGLLPQISITRTRAAEVEYRLNTTTANGTTGTLANIDRDQFIEQVGAALRHYWGGPGLTHSRLHDLNVVQAALPENDNNPARALRAVLNEAIEKQRPDSGTPDPLSPEWVIYNILNMRFIEKRKVSIVAPKLAMSDANLFRRQRVAIEAVADAILAMENTQSSTPKT